MKITGDLLPVDNPVYNLPLALWHFLMQTEDGNWAKRFQTDDEYISLIYKYLS